MTNRKPEDYWNTQPREGFQDIYQHVSEIEKTLGINPVESTAHSPESYEALRDRMDAIRQASKYQTFDLEATGRELSGIKTELKAWEEFAEGLMAENESLKQASRDLEDDVDDKHYGT